MDLEEKKMRTTMTSRLPTAQGNSVTNLGFERPFYILSFDQRSSFQKMFGSEDPLSPEQTAEIAAAKRVMYDAFMAAVQTDVLNDEAGILVDEQFGASIRQDALREGHFIACPVEKSAQDEFDFEYGEDFGATSKPCNRASARSWFGTTRRGTRVSTSGNPLV
jgi:myo-inositol catabolism protein IolC